MAATTSVSSFFAPAVMTPEALRKICKDTGGYSQPHLNDHLLLQCKGFTAIAYLDERPIFDEERRVAKAWAVGGHEAESSERSLIAEEKAAELKRDIQRWKDIQSKGKDAKVVREREWLVHMEQKKVDDEATRQRRKEQHDEMVQSEQQGRDSVEVEAYRSETSLLQVARDLRCLHARHTRERGDLTVVEGAARRQVNLMEGEDFETIGTALKSLLAGRKPESGEKFLVSLSRDSELASWIDETQQLQQQQGDGVITTELGKRMTPQQRVRQILLDAARGEDEMPVLVAEEVEVDKNEVVCCSSSSSSSLKTKSKPKPKAEDIWKMYLSWERRSAML